ncbi:MAG: hypothetical protein CMA63_06640 [Euryarchaeota archaeon]|nr:hypothetical protein [Euryarchaeota archaeon]
MMPEEKPLTEWLTFGNGFRRTSQNPLATADVYPFAKSWRFVVIHEESQRVISQGVRPTATDARACSSAVLYDMQEDSLPW